MHNIVSRLDPVRISFKTGLVFLLVFSAAVCFLNYRLHFNGLVINDSCDYAQLAKNVYKGNGYSTSVLRPLAYKFFRTLPQPEVTRMPGYPYSLGLFFRVFGPNDFSVVLFNSIFFVVLILMVYLLVYELSENVFISLIAALMPVFLKSFLYHGLMAEPNIMYAALYVGFFYFYLKYPNRTLTFGVLLGLLQLVRANTQFVFIAFFLVTVFQGSRSIKERALDAVKLSAGFLIGISPHLIRNYIIIGNPFFSLYSYSFLIDTKNFPYYTVWTKISDVNPLAFVAAHPGEMLYKSYDWFVSLLKDSISFFNPIVLLLTGITFFMPTKNPRVTILKVITVIGILMQALAILVLPHSYYYMFFFPVMLTVSVINVEAYFKKYSKIILISVLIIFAFTTVRYWEKPKSENLLMFVGHHIEKLTSKEDIILTDIPWETAWYANRKAIWLTHDMDTLHAISKTLRPTYILLSGGMLYPATVGYQHAVFWTYMLSDPNYAKGLGYEFKNVIMFQGEPVAVMFRPLNPQDVLQNK